MMRQNQVSRRRREALAIAEGELVKAIASLNERLAGPGDHTLAITRPSAGNAMLTFNRIDTTRLAEHRVENHLPAGETAITATN